MHVEDQANGRAVGIPATADRGSGPSRTAVRAEQPDDDPSAFEYVGRFEDYVPPSGDDPAKIEPDTRTINWMGAVWAEQGEPSHLADSITDPKQRAKSAVVAYVTVYRNLTSGGRVTHTYTGPDGSERAEIRFRVPDPESEDAEWWSSFSLASWLNRTTGQVNTPGRYEAESDSPWIAPVSTDFEIVGAEVTSCSAPEAARQNGSFTVTADVANADQYPGDVMVIMDGPGGKRRTRTPYRGFDGAAEIDVNADQFNQGEVFVWTYAADFGIDP